MKIAVIGAGIFGSDIAIKLATNGFNVTLFEKGSQILSGATSNSQNRLHLGLHYPRDLETAKQSVLGFEKFKNHYSETVNSHFENFYAIPKEGSKVTIEEFELFANTAGIEIQKISHSEVSKFNIKLKNISQIWKCNEAVIDMEILKSTLEQNLKSQGIRLILGTNISELEFLDPFWKVSSRECDFEEVFDVVIRCTYSNDQIEIKGVEYALKEVEFHHTLIQISESHSELFGLTIVDGDFLTVLPKGFSNQSLIYSPSISTVRKHIGFNRPKDWRPFSESEKRDFTSKIDFRLRTWLEEHEFSHTDQVLETIRTIEPNMEITDKRTSHLRNPHVNFYEVWSGKIDHCVEISELLYIKISSSFKN